MPFIATSDQIFGLSVKISRSYTRKYRENSESDITVTELYALGVDRLIWQAYIQTMGRAIGPVPIEGPKMEIKARLTALAEAASAQGLPAATEKQIDYIVALMGRRDLSVKLFDTQTLLTKRGASNYIESIPAMNKGIV